MGPQICMTESRISSLPLKVIARLHTNICVMVNRVQTLLDWEIAMSLILLIVKLDRLLLIIHDSFTSTCHCLHLPRAHVPHTSLESILILHLHRGALHLHLMLLLLVRKVMVLSAVVYDDTIASEVLIRIPHHIIS